MSSVYRSTRALVISRENSSVEAILHSELAKFILLWYFVNDPLRVYSNLKVGGW